MLSELTFKLEGSLLLPVVSILGTVLAVRGTWSETTATNIFFYSIPFFAESSRVPAYNRVVRTPYHATLKSKRGPDSTSSYGAWNLQFLATGPRFPAVHSANVWPKTAILCQRPNVLNATNETGASPWSDGIV